jgi:hypothetical protein
VARGPLAGRNLYWCPTCQPTPTSTAETRCAKRAVPGASVPTPRTRLQE